MTWQEEKILKEIEDILKKTIAQGYSFGNTQNTNSDSVGFTKKEHSSINAVVAKLNNIKTTDLAFKVTFSGSDLFLYINDQYLFRLSLIKYNPDFFDFLNKKLSDYIHKQIRFPFAFGNVIFTLEDANSAVQAAIKFKDLVIQKDQILTEVKRNLALLLFSMEKSNVENSFKKRTNALYNRRKKVEELLKDLKEEYYKNFRKNLSPGDSIYYDGKLCTVFSVEKNSVIAKKGNGHKIQINEINYIYPPTNFNDWEGLQSIKDFLPQLGLSSIYSL